MNKKHITLRSNYHSRPKLFLLSVFDGWIRQTQLWHIWHNVAIWNSLRRSMILSYTFFWYFIIRRFNFHTIIIILSEIMLQLQLLPYIMFALNIMHILVIFLKTCLIFLRRRIMQGLIFHHHFLATSLKLKKFDLLDLRFGCNDREQLVFAKYYDTEILIIFILFTFKRNNRGEEITLYRIIIFQFERFS